MANKTLDMTDDLYAYLLSVSVTESSALRSLRYRTASLPGSQMQIAPEQGQFMALLIKLIGAKRTLDIGTFTGYSALVVAEALPDDGQVISCDVDANVTEVAQEAWNKSHAGQKIQLKLAPALETLEHLIADGEQGKFDFAFIDADKRGYAGYYEKALELVRSGGLIAIDNVLWDGDVCNLEDTRESTEAIRSFNEMIHHDSRVDMSLVPIADGLTLALKK